MPDIRIKNIIIEFDGDYWHSREETILRDSQKNLLLSKLGYMVIRVPEYKFKENKENCIRGIAELINKRLDITFKHLTKENQTNENY